jgi:pilus assembly protein Flp/PilA
MFQLTLIRPWLAQALRSDRGASMVEYALLVALIALACIAAVTALGGTLSDRYVMVGDSLDQAGTAAP